MIKLHWETITHGLKTALACLVGFSITRFFSFEIDQWLVITIIVVMCAQLNVGSVLQKSYMRFLGTLIGSIIAILAILFFHNDETIYAIFIAIAAMLFSIVATSDNGYPEAGTLGAVTVVIILMGTNPTIYSALERFFEIALGIFIAALISQFVFPAHARKHLRELQAKTLRQLDSFFKVNEVVSAGIENLEDYQKLEEDIAQSLIKQRKLSTDAARELMGEEFEMMRFQQLLRAERGILRSITIMHYAAQCCTELNNIFSTNELVRDLQKSISQLLLAIAVSFEKNKNLDTTISLSNINMIKEYIFELEKNYSPEKIEYINVYLFSLEMLVDHLTMLDKLVGKK